MRWRPFSRASTLVIWTWAMLVIAEAHRLVTAKARRRAVYNGHVRRWSRGVLWLLGVRVDADVTPDVAVPVSGETCPTSRPQLVVANHRSALDIPILLAHFGGVALSRSDLARWPIIGFAARRASTIFVDRGSTGSKAAAIRAIRNRLREGYSVCVFPEGTTYEGDEVRPFAAGAFVAARDVDVVPVGLAYPPTTEFATEESFVSHARKIGMRPRMHVTMCIGAPQGPAQPAERADVARRLVQELVTRARRRAPNEQPESATPREVSRYGPSDGSTFT